MVRAIFAVWILTAAAFAAQTVEGHVVNSVTGAGIPGVAVHLIQAEKIPYSATTDSQGRFRIEAVKDGVYKPNYLAPGFYPIPGPLDRSSKPFQVTTGSQPIRLVVKMQPTGKLSGRVLDATGEPVPNASLWLVSSRSKSCKLPSCVLPHQQGKANEKGAFSITALPFPGPYLLSATAPSSWKPPEPRDGRQLGWAQAFYPGVTDPQLAAELMERPGSELWNLDIKLAAVPVHRIRGRVLHVRGDAVPKASVTLGKDFGPSFQQDTNSDGVFEFASVSDDEWRLSTALEKDGLRLWAVQRLRVAGEDLNSIELRLTEPFSIRGKVVMEVPEGVSAPKVSGISVALVSGNAHLAADRERWFLEGDADGKGDFTIRNVYPGPYQIWIHPPQPPAPYYLDSIRLGGQDSYQPEVQIVSGAQQLTVTYKLGGGTVRGIMEACGSREIRLIPQDPALRRLFTRVTTCAQNGQFEFHSVRPGEYYGLAIAGDSLIPMDDRLLDARLLSEGSRVTVRANESTTAEIRLVM